MKDFIKWLGVNEKVAKVAVWLLIIMVTLIIVNAGLASLGFPNYQITYDNIKQIKSSTILEYFVNWVIIILNFYAITLLMLRTKEYKNLFKYSLLYLILNIIISTIFNRGIVQIFIFVFFTLFGFFYKKRNPKYILYGLVCLIIDTLIQGITYLYKIKFIDYTTINEITKGILSIDYFIIIGIIIIVKEIYLKKRGEKQWDKVGYGLDNSKKKEN